MYWNNRDKSWVLNIFILLNVTFAVIVELGIEALCGLADKFVIIITISSTLCWFYFLFQHQHFFLCLKQANFGVIKCYVHDGSTADCASCLGGKLQYS